MKRFGIMVGLALIIAAPAQAANPSAQSLIELARKKFAAIRDYSVDVRLDVKSEAITVKGMTMRMYYKTPGKMRIVAKEGLAAMPRSVSLGDVMGELTKNCRPVMLKREKKNGVDCYVVRLDPIRQGSQPPTMLWLDKSGLVRATQVGGPYPVNTEWHYARVDEKYDVPRRIEAQITTPASSPYPRHGHDPDHPNRRGLADRRGPEGVSGPQKAYATLSFSNYRVNKGIRDSFFADDAAAHKRRG